MVLRFRNGKRNPPPIQRMESDDLMAAVFPAAAACQDNATGPIEIPDHVLVRQTIDDTLHEALDVDGLQALLERIESGDVRVHCADTTEPSVLAHEIITARPYAFLDDEEFQNRRTNAVHLRRGLAVDLGSIGALDPEAIEQVHAEIVPVPTTADDLHDLVSSLVAVRAREDWRPLWSELTARGRGHTMADGGAELWCTAEARGDAESALRGDDVAVAQTVRGHLEIAGITSVEALAKTTSLRPVWVAQGLAALERDGFALQGHYTPDAAGTEWVARRLLARMHSYSRRSRRQSVQPATARDLMRFLLRWQHVAPDTQVSGEAGLVAVLEQLQGFESAAVTWEPELLARRMRRYEPAWLDHLCHDGEVAWLRLTPRSRDDPDAPATAPSKATPIAVVLRDDLGWLLAAARSGSQPLEPTAGATAEIIEALRGRGACFAGDLAAATRRLPEDIERGLWDGVARGLIMSDGFGAIRARVAGRPPSGRPQPGRPRPGVGAGYRPRPQRFSRLGRFERTTAASAGRWSLVPGVDAADGASDRADLGRLDREELAETVAEQLLSRWGVVFRDLALRDSLRLPWRDLQWALRRLEDRGLVRGGRFVSGFSGEQYALPSAAEQLAHVRKLPTTGERVTINATDPLNLVGLIVPGDTVAAVRTNRVTYVDGVPEAASATGGARTG
jgi:ATP-dependent Lhr-like helicase